MSTQGNSVSASLSEENHTVCRFACWFGREMRPSGSRLHKSGTGGAPGGAHLSEAPPLA